MNDSRWEEFPNKGKEKGWNWEGIEGEQIRQSELGKEESQSREGVAGVEDQKWSHFGIIGTWRCSNVEFLEVIKREDRGEGIPDI